MAKKASSSAKKVVKKAAPAKAKPVAKKPAKAVAKPVKKAPVKPVKEPVAKAAKKTSEKSSTPEKTKQPTIKETAKAKPATLSKKAVEPEIEETAVEVETDDSAGAVKAEKSSKFKPIRIEKGNSADEKAKWAELFKKYGKEKAASYKMSDTFPALNPIQHKVLGWGFVLSNDNDRLEVLFETGIRMLISNYKS